MSWVRLRTACSSAYAIAGQDRLIMAQRHGLAFLYLKTGEISPIMPIEADMTDNRFNDGKCDRQGRFWFGSMCPGKNQGSLYRYDPDGSLHLIPHSAPLAVTQGNYGNNKEN